MSTYRVGMKKHFYAGDPMPGCPAAHDKMGRPDVKFPRSAPGWQFFQDNPNRWVWKWLDRDVEGELHTGKENLYK